MKKWENVEMRTSVRLDNLTCPNELKPFMMRAEAPLDIDFKSTASRSGTQATLVAMYVNNIQVPVGPAHAAFERYRERCEAQKPEEA